MTKIHHVKAIKVEIECQWCGDTFDVGLDEFVDILYKSIRAAIPEKEAPKKRAAPETPETPSAGSGTSKS